MPHHCTLEQVLTIVRCHFDELRAWNGGRLRVELDALAEKLEQQPAGEQTVEWLDVLASRSASFVRFLLSTGSTRSGSVRNVADEVETILISNDASNRGPGYGQVGPNAELKGQVVNATVPRLRQQIQALTSAFVPEQPVQPTVATKEQPTTKPAAAV